MYKGILNDVFPINTQGNLYTVFKPVNQVLSSYNSKINIPFNLPNRTNIRVNYGLLEVLVNVNRPSTEWKLKLNNISLTRQFKPTHQLVDSEIGMGLYKFVYDVTSILNTSEALNKEWVNLVVKYEGGEPFNIKAVLMDVIYDDVDAYTYYEHMTGFLLLKENQSIRISTGKKLDKSVTRLIMYSPKPSYIVVSTGKNILRHRIESIDEYSEYSFTLDNTDYLEIMPVETETKNPYVVISSISLYNSNLKQPILEISDFKYRIEGNKIRLKLSILNKGESSPNKLIITILQQGVPVCILQEPKLHLPPGSVLEKEVDLPAPRKTPFEYQVRLVWSKLASRWVRDEIVKIT